LTQRPAPRRFASSLPKHQPRQRSFHFLWFILIGACAGWLAGQILKGSGFGVLGNIIIGVIGAILGGMIVRLLGFAPTYMLGQLISATIGAIVLLVLMQKFGRRV
jgi:uncharacterized membrane protein YeaQ/YmgE (transglycosylase-associated protein family)